MARRCAWWTVERWRAAELLGQGWTRPRVAAELKVEPILIDHWFGRPAFVREVDRRRQARRRRQAERTTTAATRELAEAMRGGRAY